jgi:hypothetical protein
MRITWLTVCACPILYMSCERTSLIYSVCASRCVYSSAYKCVYMHIMKKTYVCVCMYVRESATYGILSLVDTVFGVIILNFAPTVLYHSFHLLSYLML